jgi:ABC-type bacteriocin/lantibiotic exporter with double-glycine peptidase domain
MERVEDVMNYKTDVSSKDEADVQTGEWTKLTGEMEISHITFGYNKLSVPLIDDFTLKLKPGGSVAFVGGSGSGKSTLAKLISGLYSPWTGEIRFEGLLRNEINRGVLTSSLAVVDQDIVLFEDTISGNITMWDKSIDEATVVAACKDAQIHDDIMQREGGYAHVIREGGRNFSGGQRQRFEIARALAQEPSIMILDEATSALDAKTEQLIMEAVKAREITLIIVAHRLSTIRDCDEILVLDKGKAVERGRHEELIRMGGKYAALISN